MRCSREHEGTIAAIIVEPIAGNIGVVPPADDFLTGLRERCTRDGILLIFDEVISGFRASAGGAQAIFGVRADLTCLGKIIGGGLPVGAYGGRAAIMEMVAPAGPVYQAGTLSGNPVAMTAGLWALEPARPRVVQGPRGPRVDAGRRSGQAAREAGVAVQVNAFGSLLTPFFTSTPVRDYQSALAANTAAYGDVLQGHAEAGCVSAAVTVRGVVPLGGAHRGTRQNDHCRRARRDERRREDAVARRASANAPSQSAPASRDARAEPTPAAPALPCLPSPRSCRRRRSGLQPGRP